MSFIKDYYQQLKAQDPVLGVILQIILVIAIMLVISRIGLFIIHRIFKRWRKLVEAKEHSESHVTQINNMHSSVKKVWRYAVLVLGIPIAITVFNLSLDSYGDFQKSILSIPLLGIVIQLVLVILLAYLALKAGSLAIKVGFEKQRQEQLTKQNKSIFKRVEIKQSKLRTLETLTLSIFKYAVYFAAALSILAVFNIPTSTVITGAGVLGVAIGFGAQNLVRDVISGAFIMFEDQFDVGDYVEACGIKGVVRGIGLRSTVLKGFDGAQHYVPNGELKIVSNLSRNYRRAMVDIGVAYSENLDDVQAVLEKLCLELRSENSYIVEGPTVLGVQNLGESEVVFRIIALTEPNEQWQAERLLRYSIKNRLDREQISIPFPHRVIINKDAEDK
ncbi:mechanosensitive ion channel family protein [Clostridium sp. 'deep sea']|uniref:mechanosensitive ion channel family protein n=1 Tax=Clostridium sp. 'deep sea' TaxID=2779445 RepID=UPI0018969C89|nr:mechanosensitive ion channel family protein [Clostridium sp. 'deep sea']QOR33982.1 mechanosensitive ion channel family protein [Clostridium sp. 'deep sea']